MTKDLYVTKTIIKLVRADGELMNFGWGENSNIVLYKGLANNYEFIVRNHDRVPVNITSYEFIARIYDNLTNELIMTKQLEPVDFSRGKLKLTFLPDDTFDLSPDTTLRVVIIMKNKATGVEEVLYTDYSTKNHIYLKVDDKADPSPTSIQIIEDFRPITIDLETYYTSGLIRGPKMKRYASSLVTMAVYFSSFTGRIFIEVSTDLGQEEVSMNWVRYEIQTGRTYKDYDNFSGIDAFNIEGNYNWIRLLYKPDDTLVDPGQITKLIVN